MIKLPDENQTLIDWLKPQIAELENICDELPFGLEEDDAMQLKVMRFALNALNATAQPVSDGWVKCSDRMPDSNEVRCLVFCRDGETRTGFTSHGDWAMNGKYYDASFVTHWMPLPAAPGGQDD